MVSQQFIVTPVFRFRNVRVADTMDYTSAQLVAGICLALLLLWLIVRLLRALLNSPHSPPLTVLYWINQLITRIMWRSEISGPMPADEGHGAVIVCNHVSGIDPLVIQLSTQRVVHWMVAREYMLHWTMAWGFRILQAIPVNRGGIDTAATKSAIRLASQGELVGMFPEGRINDSGKLMIPGRPGAIVVALKAKVPIIPCYIVGTPYNGSPTQSLIMMAHARLTIGKPIDLSEFYNREREPAVVELLTRRVLGAIATLAGQPDFPVELAGRRWRTAADDDPADVAAESDSPA